MKRIASPRALAFGSLSGRVGRPVLLEKRARMGVEGLWKCGAVESEAAAAVGVKVPVRRMPRAWTVWGGAGFC